MDEMIKAAAAKFKKIQNTGPAFLSLSCAKKRAADNPVIAKIAGTI